MLGLICPWIFLPLPSSSLLKGLPVFTCFSKNESDLALFFQEFHFRLTTIFAFYPRTPACVSGWGRGEEPAPVPVSPVSGYRETGRAGTRL